MTNQNSQSPHEILALANRLLDKEGIMDTFGHVSLRHPENPTQFYLSSAKPPALVEPEDILLFDANADPVTPTDAPLYAERVIHSEIYRRRPDVTAICHHHSPDILPFCISGVELKPVFQLGGVLGAHVPLWDSQTDFDDTKLLLTSSENGASLARALGKNWVVLMARHGATVAGRDIKEMVFRAIYSCENARAQLAAHQLGHVNFLTDGEREMTSRLSRPAIERAWDYWCRNL